MTITLASKTLRVGDKVQFRNSGTDTVTNIQRRPNSDLPVKLTFASGDAYSHYAANGSALPSRGRSSHDIVDIIQTRPNFETMATGTALKVSGTSGYYFEGNLSNGKVVVNSRESLTGSSYVVQAENVTFA